MPIAPCRAERAISAATAQIKDAEAFIHEHPNSPDLLAYVNALNALSAAVVMSDPDIIERKSTELSAAFNHDPDYRLHLAVVADAQRKQSALFLGEALAHGEKQRAFIMDFIAKNPLSKATPALAIPTNSLPMTSSRPNATRSCSPPRSAALALIKAVENDDYRRFTTVAAAEVGKVSQSERAQIERIKANVSDGAPEGYGIVLLKSGSPNLCVAVADKVDSHRELLLRTSDKIALDMQSNVVLKNTAIDDAFIGFQKRQCGAVYASAANLKILTGALTRAGASFSFSSLWRRREISAST